MIRNVIRQVSRVVDKDNFNWFDATMVNRHIPMHETCVCVMVGYTYDKDLASLLGGLNDTHDSQWILTFIDFWTYVRDQPQKPVLQAKCISAG